MDLFVLVLVLVIVIVIDPPGKFLD